MPTNRFAFFDCCTLICKKYVIALFDANISVIDDNKSVLSALEILLQGVYKNV